MKRVAVFASGSGSNFEALVKKQKNYSVELLFCDRKSAYVIQRASDLNVKSKYLSIIKEKEKYEDRILSLLKENNIELVVLAGYMKLIGRRLLKEWKGKIINIHPSLLPKYPGVHSIERAYENKDKEVGITIHYVDEGMDTGKVICQQSVELNPSWTLERTKKEIHKMEHVYYPEVINNIAKGEE